MIEGADLQTTIVGGSDEGVATAETGAKDSKLLVTLGFEPVEAAANIYDCLAACRGRSPNIRADCIVGAL